MSKREEILASITEAYLASMDFNGASLCSVSHGTTEAIGFVRELVNDGKIDALFGSSCINPAIKRTRTEGKENQLLKLADAKEFADCFLYPSPEHLAQVIPDDYLANEPYRRLLALGEPQLAVRAFDLSVLEIYRNDPRYHYSCDDMHGFISISDEYFGSPDFPEHHQILLETFGFAYDDHYNRAVASFVRYLANLSAEHQQHWKARELGSEFRIHPEFFRTQILGEFPTRIPIFTAFLMEMETINRMAEAMGRPHFFRNVPSEANKPTRFGFLVRPTQSEFNEFVLTLDKIMSDNVNKKFFGGDITDEFEEKRDDGKVVVRQKGTIQMLEDWLKNYFRPNEMAPIDDAIATFRNVRKLRQNPAHAIEIDRFDQNIFKQQRDLVMASYEAVRLIRLVLANHPAAKCEEVEPHLYEGKIAAL